jgi:hypothetical protein
VNRKSPQIGSANDRSIEMQNRRKEKEKEKIRMSLRTGMGNINNIIINRGKERENRENRKREKRRENLREKRK